MTEENIEIVEEVIPEPPAPVLDSEPMSVVIDVATGIVTRIPSSINELPDSAPIIEEPVAEEVVEEEPVEEPTV